MTNKCTNNSQNITLLHVSTVSCHLQGVCDHYPAKLGTAVTQWLRYCSTNRKVADSIPDCVIGIFFIVINSFRSHYVPGIDSASNRNEYQEHFLGAKAAVAEGWRPYHHPVLLLWNLETLTSWNPLGHSRPVTGLLYRLPCQVTQVLQMQLFVT
jgi:hypothetical protein